jgi:antitoxin VapB
VADGLAKNFDEEKMTKRRRVAAAESRTYKEHRAGSRKGDVHRAFDEEGEEAALRLARKFRLKESSVRTWMSKWRNPAGARNSDSETAKVFKQGNSQAVRLPKEFRLTGDRVRVRREGNAIVLEPLGSRIDDVFAEIDRLAQGQFMKEGRKQPTMPAASDVDPLA